MSDKSAVSKIRAKIEKQYGSIPSIVKRLYGIDIPPEEGWVELPPGWRELGPYEEVSKKDVLFLNTKQRWVSVSKKPTAVGMCAKFVTWSKSTTIPGLRQKYAKKLWEEAGQPDGKEEEHWAEACKVYPDDMMVKFARQEAQEQTAEQTAEQAEQMVDNEAG